LNTIDGLTPLSKKTATELTRPFMKESSMIGTLLKRAVVLMLVGAFGFSFTASVSYGKQENAAVKVDYASTQQEILKFEAVINDVINSIFSSNTFAVVQRAKGAYLEGYGVSFAFLINIHRAVIRTPFGQVRSRPNLAPEMKKQRIEELKENLVHLLQDSGETFQQLRKEDCVTLIAFIEDRNIPDEPNANKTIILSALKKDLDELGHKSDRLKEFKQRIKIVEY
jgi:hypothetical protein